MRTSGGCKPEDKSASTGGQFPEIPTGEGTNDAGGTPFSQRRTPPLNGTIPDAVPYFRSEFAFYWYYEFYSVKDALTTARRNIGDAQMRYIEGPKANQRYQPGDDLYISGYYDLGYDEYNLKNDIPRL